MSTNKRTDTLIYSYNGCYFVIKKNELVIHVTTWRNLENIMLGERSQTQKNRCPICHLYKFKTG